MAIHQSLNRNLRLLRCSRPSDETLLLSVAERDMGFRSLYERHAGWLAIRLIRRCNDRDLVADAIQDAFAAVWQRPQGFRGDGDIAARPTAPASRTSEIDIH